ncbi:MAG: hypothetical protein ACTSPY_14805 [Candidatus Helarchaeota archaeon]
MLYTYGDLPDTLQTKRFFPLGNHLWRIYKRLGWEFLSSKIDHALTVINYNLVKNRLTEAILTAKDVIAGKIKNPEKIVNDTLFPPGALIRADLGVGGMKLYYGESCTCSYMLVMDTDQEIKYILTAHLEDGIPVDWWLTEKDDELLNRRHIKFGYKLKDIPKHSKNFQQAGFRLMDILKDIRNERTPQFANSTFNLALAWGTGAWNLGFEISSYEAMGAVHDGISSKTLHGMADNWYSYIPWPPIIQSMIYSGRNKFITMSVGLFTEHRLYLQYVDDQWMQMTKEHFPETYEIGMIEQWTKLGIPLPYQTLQCQLPDYKKKQTYINEDFDWKYPKGPRINLESLGISIDNAYNGYYLDITNDFIPKENEVLDLKDKIISIGSGRNAKIVKKE